MKKIFNYIVAKIFQNQSQQATDLRTFQTGAMQRKACLGISQSNYYKPKQGNNL